MPADVDPTVQEYLKYCRDQHASRTLAPKTLERYLVARKPPRSSILLKRE